MVAEIGRRAGVVFADAHRVRRIRVDDGRAVGVEVEGPARGSCSSRALVVSDVGLHGTYRTLLADRHTPPAVDAVLRAARPTSAVILYCSLRDDPRPLGLHGENHWVFDTLDTTTLVHRPRAAGTGLPVAVVDERPDERTPGAQIMTSLDSRTWSHAGRRSRGSTATRSTSR